MAIRKKFLALFLSLMMGVLFCLPHQVYAATESDELESEENAEPVQVIKLGNNSNIEIYDCTSDGSLSVTRSGSVVGSNVAIDFKNYVSLTTSSMVTGHNINTVKVKARCTSDTSHVTDMVVYGPGCGFGKTMKTNNTLTTIATGLNTSSVTYSFVIDDYYLYNVMIYCYFQFIEISFMRKIVLLSQRVLTKCNLSTLFSIICKYIYLILNYLFIIS